MIVGMMKIISDTDGDDISNSNTCICFINLAVGQYHSHDRLDFPHRGDKEFLKVYKHDM